MRNRHFPRLCASCQAPMARQQDACWRCGAQWGSEQRPPTTLRVIPGAAPAQVDRAIGHRIAAVVATQVHAATPLRADLDRWTDEGGSFAYDAEAAIAATATRR
jgi:predicted amidophosphoribosyltransferase